MGEGMAAVGAGDAERGTVGRVGRLVPVHRVGSVTAGQAVAQRDAGRVAGTGVGDGDREPDRRAGCVLVEMTACVGYTCLQFRRVLFRCVGGAAVVGRGDVGGVVVDRAGVAAGR